MTTDAVDLPEVEPLAESVPTDALHAALAAAAPGSRFEAVGGDDVAFVERNELVAFVGACRDAGFEMFVDLCAVDYLRRNPRFEVVINLLSLSKRRRIRIRVGVPGTEAALPSISGIYPGANFYEREAFDLFGLDFVGHPDLTRILLPDEWEGHPLRKDHPMGSVPIQFKEANRAS